MMTTADTKPAPWEWNPGPLRVERDLASRLSPGVAGRDLPLREVAHAVLLYVIDRQKVSYCPDYLRTVVNDLNPAVVSLPLGKAACFPCARDWPSREPDDGTCDICRQPRKETARFAVPLGPQLIVGNACERCAVLFGPPVPEEEES